MDNNIRRHIELLNNRYNGDFDLIQGGPDVTWADKQLLDIIELLEERVSLLESRFEEKQEIDLESINEQRPGKIDRQLFMDLINELSVELAFIIEEEDRDQWLSYLLECFEAECGDGILEIIADIVEERLENKIW